MNREKMRAQTARLRNKRVIQKSRVITPKAKVKKGVVKLQSFSSKKTTAPAAPPPANTKTIRPSPSQHMQIMSSAKTRHKGGCGGCRRKIAR